MRLAEGKWGARAPSHALAGALAGQIPGKLTDLSVNALRRRFSARAPKTACEGARAPHFLLCKFAGELSDTDSKDCYHQLLPKTSDENHRRSCDWLLRARQPLASSRRRQGLVAPPRRSRQGRHHARLRRAVERLRQSP